ncbi:MAG: sensor histidine kinase [Pirellula sp.]
MNTARFAVRASSERIRNLPLVGIFVSFLLVAGVCVLGLWNDLSNRRSLIMSSEISNLESHIGRTIIRIQSDLREGKTLDDFSEPTVAPWLVEHWFRMIELPENRIYAYIEDAAGSIRSSGGKIDSLKDRVLERQQVPGFPKVVQYVRDVTRQVESREAFAIEIGLPIEFRNQRIGVYRTAIPMQWLDGQVASAERSRWFVWFSVLLAMTMIVATTAVFVFRLGSHSRDLEVALKNSETRRLADLSKLVVSMAHELRNPLNSIRLNLFSSEKLIRGESPMDQREALVMIHESVGEIERVNELIGQLLGFVKTDESQETWLNFDSEIQSVLQFLKTTHTHHGIQIDYRFDDEIAIGKVSKKYLRQILINLLQNAQQAMISGGQIRISLRCDSQNVIVSIEDSGPGVPSQLLEKIFEPFYSTRPDGAGLGLAVVRNLIEASGGSVSCQRSEELGGLKLTLRFQAKPVSVDALKAES